MTLPPGQRRVPGFPRFGTHLQAPPPPVPADPQIVVSGAGMEPVVVRVADLATLPRQHLTADFHCVAGWSATGLHWTGVPFAAFYRALVEPALPPGGAAVTHCVFAGLDGFESAMTVEDALDEVLLADELNGRPLGADHGAPLRLVSPERYGYVSTKHLARIDLRTAEPDWRRLGAASATARLFLLGPLVLRHPRARVWQEERHPYLPARLLRPLYRLTVRAGIAVGRRDSGEVGGRRSHGREGRPSPRR